MTYRIELLRMLRLEREDIDDHYDLDSMSDEALGMLLHRLID